MDIENRLIFCAAICTCEIIVSPSLCRNTISKFWVISWLSGPQSTYLFMDGTFKITIKIFLGCTKDIEIDILYTPLSYWWPALDFLTPPVSNRYFNEIKIICGFLPWWETGQSTNNQDASTFLLPGTCTVTVA